MAKKGQTFKIHSKETKEEILRKYFIENQSARSLGEEYGIPTLKNTTRFGLRILHTASSETRELIYLQ